MKTHIFKEVDGCTLDLDVYPPVTPATRGVIFWVHGGALIGGNRGPIPPDHARQYASQGFAVVSPEYRLAPETKLEAIIQDVKDAYHWVVDSGEVMKRGNSVPIVALGHSAGGYLSLMLGFCVRPRPKAIVSFYGYGDLVGPWYSQPDAFYCSQPLIPPDEARRGVGSRPVAGSTDPKRFVFYHYCRQHGIWPREVSAHDPDRESAWFVPYCPDQNVSPDYPPTLLFHGDKDTDVPYELSVRMAAVLKQHNVSHELITMHGQGHGFEKRQHTFDRLFAFLKSHGI